MKKHFLLFAVIFILAPGTIFAQENYTIRQLSDMVGQLNWSKNITKGSKDIAGTPYLDEEFKKGDVFYDGEFKITQVPLRLNLYNDEFEYKDKNTILAFVNPSRIDKIVIENQTYIYVEKNSEHKLFGFVKMWNASLPSVLTKMKIDFLKEEELKPYVEPKPDRFDRASDRHYIMKSKNEVLKITSVKKLIKSLENHAVELSEFAKKEKISAGDPEELAKLLVYFHELE